MQVFKAIMSRGGLAALALVAMAAAGHAVLPEPYQMGLQPAATDIMQEMTEFHDKLLWIITAITIFVMALLLYVLFRFNEKANPTPSKTSHNTTVEVLWTVIPILILVFIAVPSFKLLYAQHDVPKPDLTIKAIGSQWYWDYEYPDQDDLSFSSIMLEDADLKEGQPRLLAVDNEVVVPVNKVVLVLVTATDVIHNWYVPAFGSKIDAVPGRITSTWFKAREPGVYYGQCGELCGSRHAFMPIAVRVVEEPVFNQWVATMKAGNEDAARELISRATDDKATKLAAANE